MSSAEFDDLLRKKIEEGRLDYEPTHWQALQAKLDERAFDEKLKQKVHAENIDYNPSHWQQMAAMLSATDFDNTLKQKIESEELAYNPAHWNQVAAQLPTANNVVPFKSPKRIIPWAVGVAAALAIILSTVILLNKNYDNAPVIADQNKNLPTKNGVSNEPINNAPAIQAPDTNTASVSNQNNLAIKKSGATPSNPSSKLPFSNQHNIISSQDNNAINTPLETNTPKVAAQDNHQPEQSVRISPPPSATDDRYANNYPPSILALNNSHQTEGRTSVGIGGGVNYGNFKTGVTFGISARQYIGKKVFVDGTVAMNVNQGNNMLNASQNTAASFVAGRPAGARGRPANATSDVQKAKDFYYIQFNPTIGLKLSKKLSAAAGPDFQQAMRDNATDKTIAFSKDGNVKYIPDMDMGITGKLEYSVTPNIQTGVIYREGVNSIVDKQYFNRRYVQVQLKYTIPLRD